VRWSAPVQVRDLDPKKNTVIPATAGIHLSDNEAVDGWIRPAPG